MHAPTESRQLYFSLTTIGTEFAKPIGEIVNGELVVRDDMTYEEWTDGLRGFKSLASGLERHLASYIKFGEIKFGKQQTEDWLEQLEFDLNMVNRAIKINGVPESVKRPGLEADHLIVLSKSKLKLPDLVKWAKTTVAQNLSASQLKASIAVGEVVDPHVARSHNSGIASVYGVRGQYDIWVRRVGGAEGIKLKGSESAQDIIRELGPIRDLVDELEQWVESLE